MVEVIDMEDEQEPIPAPIDNWVSHYVAKKGMDLKDTPEMSIRLNNIKADLLGSPNNNQLRRTSTIFS